MSEYSLNSVQSYLFLLSISVIQVQFWVTEFSSVEEQRATNITFVIDNEIATPTHFLVHTMTYKAYDMAYPALKAKYPDLQPIALNDEYDQAERKFLID